MMIVMMMMTMMMVVMMMMLMMMMMMMMMMVVQWRSKTTAMNFLLLEATGSECPTPAAARRLLYR